MKKSASLAIILLVLAFSTAALGYLYTTRGQEATDKTPLVAVGAASAKWSASSHANSAAPAFRHWDEDGEIPAACASCHSAFGRRDFFGLDGTAAGVTDNPARLGSVVDCSVCHNEAIANITSVKFPSGLEVAADPSFASCWSCHQGNQAGINGSLAEKTGSLGPDEKAEGLSFVNPHYLNVAGIYLGAEANAGYQYPGKSYANRFQHATGVQTCTECHDPHSLHLADPGFAKCQTCHAEVQAWPDQQKIRKTDKDLDGDGNATESTYDEINGLLDRSLAAILQYAKETAKAPIGASDQYPYWFADANENGTQEEDEKNYADWTPRLMYAAFNYRLVKTSAGYLHNSTYSAQLLIDSIEDLAAADSAISMAGIERP